MRRVFTSIYLWGMVAVVTVLCFTALLPVVLITAPFDHNRNATHWVASIWARLIFALNPLWTLEIEGKERLDRKTACLLAVNHQSMGDIITLYALGLPFKWISKREMFFVPLIGWSMFLAGYIPVLRGNKQSHKRCVQLAKSWLLRGVPIMMFPEGTRSPDGRIHGFRDGAFRMSVETGVPVVPVALEGTRDAIPKGSWIFDAKCRVRIVVGEPIKPPVVVADGRAASKEVDAIRETARKWIVREVARMRGTSVAAVDALPSRARSSRVTTPGQPVGA